MRKLAAALAFSAAWLGAGSAFAQMENFGSSGTIAISGERLFAFQGTTLKREDNQGNNDSSSSSSFGFGWGANNYPFNVPRVGFDYFVIDQLSIGGALGYFTFNDDNDRPRSGDLEAFLLAARVGYWIPFGGVAGFWPRGGFTYHSLSPEGDDNDENGLALTLEGMFGIGPSEHFAFLVGPTFDIDFIGSHQCRPNGRDDNCNNKYRTLGVQVGLMGWF